MNPWLNLLPSYAICRSHDRAAPQAARQAAPEAARQATSVAACQTAGCAACTSACRPGRGARLRLWLMVAGASLGLANLQPLAAQSGSETAASDSNGAETAAQLPALQSLRLEADDAFSLDGALSEPFWERAMPIDDFKQREPLEGVAATEHTEVRVAWDDDNLYVGVRAFDSDPDAVVARLLQRDQIMNARGFGGLQFQGDDAVAVVLDPFDDDRNGFIFATNPNGALFEALLTDEGGQLNVDWQGVWQVAGTRTPEGWSAEFSIPFRTLRVPSDGRAWGLNVSRFVARKQEQTLWTAWDREGGGFERVSLAGRLEGLDDLPRSRFNVETKPFILGAARGELSETNPASPSLDYSSNGDVGLDLKSEVIPGLVLDLTLNTDFAQAEVDNQQVNLTRFFPERRDFFLENAGIFDFGQRGFGPPPFLMFFSRRIGIGSEGEVPILAGGRLTGRVGNQTLGLLSVRTDGVPGTPATDGSEAVPGQGGELFQVARIKRDVGASNYVGAMVTDRRGNGASNTVAGVDARFFLHPTLVTEAFVARSFTEGAGGEGGAYRLNANFTTDLWGLFVNGFQVDDEMNAASGFVNRRNVREVRGSVRRSFRPGFLNLRKVDFRLSTERVTTIDGRFQDSQYSLNFSPNFNTGDNFNLSIDRGRSQVDDAFTLADSLPVPAGEYSTNQWSVRMGATDARALSGRLNIRQGDFFGGTIRSWNGSISFTPSPALSLEPGFERSKVSLPSGSFTADITSLRLTWALSPLMTTNAFIQYNGLTDRVITNVRFNFIHRPGSDLFVVFSENRFREDDFWGTDDRGLVVKLTYLMRL